MKTHYIVQVGVGLMFFIIATIAAWYEGSALVDYPSEWKYTAKITYWLKGAPETYKDINQLDFFIYAAKFRPVFAYVMCISAMYLFVLSLFLVWKRVNMQRKSTNL